jgi:hypothetical protein
MLHTQVDFRGRLRLRVLALFGFWGMMTQFENASTSSKSGSSIFALLPRSQREDLRESRCR